VYQIREASGKSDYEDSRQLFEEYASDLGFDLGFQHFKDELASLPGEYAPPAGCILLAESKRELCGCVALRPLSEDICEMKHLYVRPAHRGSAIGRALAVEVIKVAQERGYARMRLDTISSMVEALCLYESLGFREIPPYRHNPMDGARFLELELARDGSVG
jgi:ribosomal protein S18 acetylase RimI-like enzyme